MANILIGFLLIILIALFIATAEILSNILLDKIFEKIDNYKELKKHGNI